jgi:hypothetical protein
MTWRATSVSPYWQAKGTSEFMQGRAALAMRTQSFTLSHSAHLPGRTMNTDPANGKAVQVDRIKPTLKAPRIERLKLNRDESLPNFTFNFSLRHYTAAGGWTPPAAGTRTWRTSRWGLMNGARHVIKCILSLVS